MINGIHHATGFPYEFESEQLQDRKLASEKEIFALLQPLAAGHADLTTEVEKTAMLKQEAKGAHEEARSMEPAPGAVIGRRRGGQFFPNKRYQEYIDANRRAMGGDGAVERHMRSTANQYYTLLEDTENASVAANYAKILKENELMRVRWEEYSGSLAWWTSLVMIIVGIPFAAAVFFFGFATPFLLIGVLMSFAERGDDRQTS